MNSSLELRVIEGEIHGLEKRKVWLVETCFSGKKQF